MLADMETLIWEHLRAIQTEVADIEELQSTMKSDLDPAADAAYFEILSAQ